MAGDFNVNTLKRDDPKTVLVMSFAKKLGLVQLIKGITRPGKKSGTCIDLIFTDCNYISESGILDDFVSDHFSVYCIRKKDRERRKMVSRVVRDYKAFDNNSFNQLVLNKNWDVFDNSNDPDVQWEIILSYVEEILSVMCPFKRVNSRKKTTPWLTKDIFRQMREKKALIKLYKRNNDPELLKSIHIKRNRLNSLIEKSKTEFITTCLNKTVDNPKKFWKLIKGLIDKDDSVDITSYTFRDPDTDEPVLKKDTPEFLNKYFVNIAERISGPRDPNQVPYVRVYEHINDVFDFLPPSLEDMYIYKEGIDLNSSSCIPGVNNMMCKTLLDCIPSKFRHMFATSLFLGKFPSVWSKAYVTLIPKDGDKNYAGNWRPISQTIIFAKILEKIIHHQLLTYLVRNNIISSNQFGFLPGKSTQDAVFNTLRHVYSGLNNNKLTGMLFLDVAKAFNCIDHVILYEKLKDVGASDRVITWFRSYLSRSQIMKYGEVTSNEMSTTAGIAQGTVLGPLIFIFYINDCIKVLNKAKVSMFADDCILYYSGNNWARIHNVLQSDLNRFVNWTTYNRLTLNENKTQAMIIGIRNKLSNLHDPTPFIINNKSVIFVRKYTHLGFIFDCEMSLVPLCKSLEKRLVDKIYMLKKLRKYVTYKAALQIYKQTMLPILDYSGLMLLACNKTKKHDFQVMQNDVLRFCENKKLEDRISIENLHAKARLLSLEQRLAKQVLTIMYKLSQNEENRKVPSRVTRTINKYVFRVDTKIGTKYANSPYYKGTQLWDKLPETVQKSESLFIFKKELDKIFKVFDKKYFV